MPTRIIKCTCKHETQDVMYGAGNRIANEMRTGQLKCTVCGTVQGAPSTFRPSKVVEEPAKKPDQKVVKEKKPKEKRGKFK